MPALTRSITVSQIAVVLALATVIGHASTITTSNPAAIAAFQSGATVQTFDSLTVQTITDYSAQPAAATIFNDPTQPNAWFNSGGGNFFNPPATDPNTATPIAILAPSGDISDDKFSGNNVAGPLEINTTTVFGTGAFMEILFPTAVSKVGFYVPYISPGESLTLFLKDENADNISGADSGGTLTAGQFIGIERTSADVRGLSLISSDGKFTIDDLTYATTSDTSNEPPTANAGPDQTVASGALVTLDGTGSSDPDGDPLTYSWVQASGPSVTLSSPAVGQPTFTAPAGPATLMFQLEVCDGSGGCAIDTVTVTVLANELPTANAGPDQTVTSGALVTLDGSGSSDPDGDPLTYSWEQASGPSVTLSSPTAVKPTFTAPAGPATLMFQLQVCDGSSGCATDIVTVTVLANELPTANAGPDQTVASGALVTLDGTGSSDPDGDPLTYSWVQASGPSVTLSSPAVGQPTFTAPAGPATLMFQLEVCDGSGGCATDTVTVTVLASGSDSDADGIPDSSDLCPGTAPGDVVDATGCSIPQLVPCSGPASGGIWKNHGQYVSAVAKAAQQLLADGRMTEDQVDNLITEAGRSSCGKRR